MEITERHTTAFGMLLRKKGYHGLFWTTPGYPDKIAAILSQVFRDKEQDFIRNGYLVATLASSLEQRGAFTSRIDCHFGIMYSEETGISVTDIKVACLTFDDVPLASLYVKICSNTGILPRRHAVGLIKKSMRCQRRLTAWNHFGG